MTRKRFAALSVVAAAAVIGLLLFLLLGGGEGAPEGRKRGPRERGRPAAGEAAEEAALPPTGGGGTGKARPASEGESPDSDGSQRPTSGQAAVPPVPGQATLEDGTPLAGVEFNGGNGLFREASDADGGFELVNELAYRISHPWAIPVAAAGGTLDGTVVTSSPGADRLLLTFRDRPGTAHVRLVDAASGVPVTDTSGLRMDWEFPGGVLTVRQEKDPGLGGWIPVTEGRLPEAVGVDPEMLRVDPAKVTLVLSVPGWEEGRLPLPEVKGRREIRVNAVEPDARGEVECGGLGPSVNGEFSGQVSASLRSLDPDPLPVPAELMGLPTKPGPFALYGLPDGAWEIEVAVDDRTGSIRRARRSFERRGGTAEIGTIEVKEGGTVRVRVVDAAEKPMPQAFVVAVRPEENPDQGRPLYPDGEGRVALSDLEPGVDHRVQVRGLPRLLEQTVRAETGGKAKEVEFRWPEKAVPCRITLVVDGKVVANPDGSRTIPATIKDSPLPRDRGSWRTDGTFEADLVPGTYLFSAWATAKEGGGLVLFTGEVTVPAGESFETRLEMRVP